MKRENGINNNFNPVWIMAKIGKNYRLCDLTDKQVSAQMIKQSVKCKNLNDKLSKEKDLFWRLDAELNRRLAAKWYSTHRSQFFPTNRQPL